MHTGSYLTKVCPENGATKKGDPPVWQGLTITYKTALENFPYREQFNKTAYSLARILNNMADEYSFYPEFTDVGRIHYHGKYKPKSKHKALQGYEQLRKTGYIKIESTIKDHTAWNDYIRKEYDSVKKLINRDPRVDKVFYNEMVTVQEQKLIDMEKYLNKMRSDLSVDLNFGVTGAKPLPPPQ